MRVVDENGSFFGIRLFKRIYLILECRAYQNLRAQARLTVAIRAIRDVKTDSKEQLRRRRMLRIAGAHDGRIYTRPGECEPGHYGSL